MIHEIKDEQDSVSSTKVHEFRRLMQATVVEKEDRDPVFGRARKESLDPSDDEFVKCGLRRKALQEL
jgi:hypothetical protein